MSDSLDPISTQNQFIELSSVESEDDAEDVPDIDIPRVASFIPNVLFEPELVIMEAISDIVMFLGDMERTRLYLRALRKDYKSSKIDLITASVTTNTAIDLLQRPHDELMTRVMPMFGNNFQKMISMTFGLLRGHTSGQLDTNIPKFDLVDDQDVELAKVFDFTMLPFLQILDDLADKLNSGPSPLSRSSKYGNYDPDAALHQQSFRSGWQQCHILLSKAFSDISFILGLARVIGLDCGGWTRLDAIIRLMDDFFRTRESSLHLTFAMRIYMDINFTLGSDTSRGHQYLGETARRMVKTLEQRPSVEGTIPHFR